MLSFDFAQQISVQLPTGQLYCRGILMSAKKLKKANDATGGLAAALAAKGISPLHNLPITARDIIFVVDRYFVYRPGLHGPRTCCDQLDFLLNGSFYQLVTRFVNAPTHKNSDAWSSYEPVSIQKVGLTQSMVQAMFTKERQQPVPAPHVVVDLPPPVQQPSLGFYMDPQPGPESAYVTVFPNEPA